jgi:transposase
MGANQRRTKFKENDCKDLIEAAGCKIIFLPPYCPDLNPIEKFWTNMKRWIKDKVNNLRSLFDSIFTVT